MENYSETNPCEKIIFKICFGDYGTNNSKSKCGDCFLVRI